MSDPIDPAEKIVDGIEADAALAKGSASENLGAELIVISEEEMFADVDFSAGTNEAFPFVRVLLQLA